MEIDSEKFFNDYLETKRQKNEVVEVSRTEVDKLSISDDLKEKVVALLVTEESAKQNFDAKIEFFEKYIKQEAL